MFGTHFRKTVFLFVNQKMRGPPKFFYVWYTGFLFHSKKHFVFLCESHAIFQNRLDLFWSFLKPNSFSLFLTVAQITPMSSLFIHYNLISIPLITYSISNIPRSLFSSLSLSNYFMATFNSPSGLSVDLDREIHSL